MKLNYTNYRLDIARNPAEKRRFLANWQRIYANELQGVPLYFPDLNRVLQTYPPHLARFDPQLIEVTAQPRDGFGHAAEHPIDSVNVTRRHPSLRFAHNLAAAVLLFDERRQDKTAYLSLLRSADQDQALDLLLESAADLLYERGYDRVLGPTGLAPHLGSGALQNHWDKTPPLYTPANPAYIPTLFKKQLRPLVHSYLYQIPIPPNSQPHPNPSGSAQLSPLDPDRLSQDLLPLFQAACLPQAGFPPPDQAETEFILSWLRRWPLIAWGAHLNGEIIGFILLQGDLAPHLLLAQGGSNPLWRLWLHLFKNRFVKQGRLLYGAVDPPRRGQGIGRQLIVQALKIAQEQGWQSLSAGPVPVDSPTTDFLENQGFTSVQRYILYEANF